jgi:hypothetical protein
MQIAGVVKGVGNIVGMTVIVGGGFAISVLAIIHIFKKTLILDKTIDKYKLNELQFKIGVCIITAITSFLLALIVFPRLLPFTQYSYGVIPHFNWRWIEARLPS